MIKLNSGVKIYISLETIDMRKAIDGLVSLIESHFNENPSSGNLFLFFNKNKDKAKIIFLDRNGYVLHYKRMEKHRFHVPKMINEGHLTITEIQLQGLFAGLDYMLMGKFSEINYYEYA